MYEASVATHVVAAIIGFGATFAYPVIQLVAERREPAALPFAMDAILAISRLIAVPAALLVGATGIYQLLDGPYDLSDAWLAAGGGLYLAVIAAAVFYLAPSYRRARDAARAAAASNRVAPEYLAAIRGTRIVGPLVAAAIVAIAVLMEVKPG
jgi:uncharacterized membrane protein